MKRRVVEIDDGRDYFEYIDRFADCESIRVFRVMHALFISPHPKSAFNRFLICFSHSFTVGKSFDIKSKLYFSVLFIHYLSTMFRIYISTRSVLTKSLLCYGLRTYMTNSLACRISTRFYDGVRNILNSPISHRCEYHKHTAFPKLPYIYKKLTKLIFL